MFRTQWKFYLSYQETDKSQLQWEKTTNWCQYWDESHAGIIWKAILKMPQQALENSLKTNEKIENVSKEKRVALKKSKINQTELNKLKNTGTEKF